MRAIREVYKPLADAKADYSRFDITDRVCDAVYGVSPYHGVLILNRAADYCTGRALATALTDPHSIIAYAEAAGFLGVMADRLDEELAAKTAEFFGGAA